MTMTPSARILLILTLLCAPSLIMSLIIPAQIPLPLPVLGSISPPHPAQDKPHWDFDLYNNKRCAGPASKMSGWGSSGCRTDVPAGGAKAYTLKDLDSNCSVTLYKDQRCSQKHDIGSIDHRFFQGCHSIGRKKYVRSFEVKCH